MNFFEWLLGDFVDMVFSSIDAMVAPFFVKQVLGGGFVVSLTIGAGLLCAFVLYVGASFFIAYGQKKDGMYEIAQDENSDQQYGMK